ncbi:hypothetical protein ACLB2K_033735 [Fragaria x ananassa]|uniref:uncharacterized protein LOC105351163 n=1 Tax=Fragaria vesca subsp. vesca TaxID=101020 RepID=UPI0005C8FB34|nr:PREDICTED: uncharacterized protein LOC105351163 [Fragaria vesca subsp. vesca]
MHQHNHLLGRPCLHCHPHTYIRMVQHLIEKCLLFHMSRDQCINALARHANITPLITLTVWRELQKENRHFFQAYFNSISPTRSSMRSHIQNAPRFAGRRYWK